MSTESFSNPLYKSRTLSGRLSAAFEFVHDNFGYLLKQSTFILVPFCLIQAVYTYFYRDVVELSYGSVINTCVTSLIVLLGICLFSSFILVCLQKYAELGYLPGYKLKELKKPVWQNAGKILMMQVVLLILFTLLCGLIVALWFLTPYSLMLTIPLIFFLAISLSLVVIIYIFENKGVFASFKESLRFVIPYWGSTFSILLLIGILVGIIQTVGVMPYYIGLFVEELARLASAEGGEAASLPGFFDVMLAFLSFIYFFVAMFSSGMVLICLVFQYGSIATACKEKEEENILEHAD